MIQTAEEPEWKTAYAFAKYVKYERLVGVERFQELASVYSGNPLTISEINWSHDGSFILFSTDFIDGSGKKVLWKITPDGKNIVYETRQYYAENINTPYKERASILLADSVSGNIIRTLWNGDSGYESLSTSPDGKKIALAGGTGLSILDIADGKITKLIEAERIQQNGKVVGGSRVNSPKWSDNGEFVVYWETAYQQAKPANTNLKVVSLDGKINEKIFESPAMAESIEMPEVGISPDGKFIIAGVPFVPFNHPNDNIDNAGIYKIDLGAHVIPEFPYSTLISAIAISGIICYFTIVRARKLGNL